MVTQRWDVNEKLSLKLCFFTDYPININNDIINCDISVSWIEKVHFIVGHIITYIMSNCSFKFGRDKGISLYPQTLHISFTEHDPVTAYTNKGSRKK